MREPVGGTSEEELGLGLGVNRVHGEEVRSESERKEVRRREEEVRRLTAEEEEAGLEEELGALVQDMQGCQWSDGTNI